MNSPPSFQEGIYDAKDIMRFAITFLIMIMLILNIICSPAKAQTSAANKLAHQSVPPTFEGYEALDTNIPVTSPRIQRGRQTHKLYSHHKLEHKLYARRLGAISAIAAQSTTLYTADKNSGQIYRITDRNADGKAENPRPLLQRFDTPTGLTIIKNEVYVADKSGVWQVTQNESPILIASLKNIKTTQNHILRAGETYLWLGLTTQSGKAQLLKINLPDGTATLVKQSPGTLLDLVFVKNQPPWMLISQNGQTFLGPNSDQMSPLGNERGHVFIPDHEKLPSAYPKEIGGHIWLSRAHSGDVAALPVVMMRPLPIAKTIFGGFTSQSKNSHWGSPGPLYMDARGLFVSDSINGDLWHITGKPQIKTPEISLSDKASTNTDNVDIPQPQDTDNIEAPKESSAPKTLPIKSGIGNASTLKRGSLIDQASQIEYGSSLKASSKEHKRKKKSSETNQGENL